LKAFLVPNICFWFYLINIIFIDKFIDKYSPMKKICNWTLNNIWGLLPWVAVYFSSDLAWFETANDAFLGAIFRRLAEFSIRSRFSNPPKSPFHPWLNNETRPETKERDIVNPFGVEDRAIAKVPQSPTQIYFRLFNLDYNQKQTPLIVESWSRSANSTVAEHPWALAAIGVFC